MVRRRIVVFGVGVVAALSPGLLLAPTAMAFHEEACEEVVDLVAPAGESGSFDPSLPVRTSSRADGVSGGTSRCPV